MAASKSRVEREVHLACRDGEHLLHAARAEQAQQT
jgi:hypothetical protein